MPVYTAYTNDSLQNLTAGLSTEQDKLYYNSWSTPEIDKAQLDAAYRANWMARKIVDIPAYDMTREWRSWKAEQPQIEAIEGEEKRLGLIGKLKDAITWDRLHGGGAIILGFGDADPTKPAPKKIAKGGLKYIHAVSRYDIGSAEIELDLLSPWYGEPKYYDISSETYGSIRLHPSRVVPFISAKRMESGANLDFWGDSVLMAADDAVKHAATVNAVIAALIFEAKLDVMGIPELSSNLATKAYADRLAERFRLAARLKNSQNIILRDKDEEWDQKQISFSNLPEIIQTYQQIVCGAADIPATRFLGRSPAGMNATGESDLRNFYDSIGADQRVWLSPAMRRLDEALIASALGDLPKEVWYEWNPLWQQSEKEKAETDKLTAETAAIYAKTGLVPSEALAKGVQNRLVEDGTYPGLEEGLKEAAAALEFDPLEEDPETDPDLESTPGVTGDAAPRTLYVSRKVKNASEILKWAKAQGFKKTLTADDLHVTIAFSKTPVDWMKTGQSWDDELTVPAGGARIVEPLGPKGAVVLLFNSSALAWRHQDIRRAGASWDWPDYQPHITITYDGKDVDLSQVEPYRGEIVLGPEIFQEVVEDWDENVKER